MEAKLWPKHISERQTKQISWLWLLPRLLVSKIPIKTFLLWLLQIPEQSNLFSITLPGLRAAEDKPKREKSIHFQAGVKDLRSYCFDDG